MLLKIQQRLIQLDNLISSGATGPPKELAAKLNITERAWYQLRYELVHDLHVPIKYDRFKRSYVYEKSGNIFMGFEKL